MLSAGLLMALSPAEIRAVVSHEWGHVSRRDPLRLTLLRWCSELLWFLPIVRVLAQDCARAMEEAADDVAVVLTAQPLDLAAALVKAAQAQALPSGSAVSVLGEEGLRPAPTQSRQGPAALRRHCRAELGVTARVERLLAVAPPRTRRRHARDWVVSGLVATCLLMLLFVPRQPDAATALAALLAHQPRVGCYMLPQQG
jgi:hypothetical protein